MRLKTVTTRAIPGTWVPIAAMVLALLACKTSGSTDTSPSASASAAAGTKGLAALDNDAEVVNLAKAALQCKFDEYGNFESGCPAMKAFDDSKLFEEGKQDKTLLNLMEDSDEKVRSLGANKLYYSGKAAFTDKVLAERLVAAAEGEKSEKVANNHLGGLVAKVETQPTGLFPKIKALFGSTPLKAVKKELAGGIINTNYKDEAVWSFVKELLNHEDAEVRLQAIGSYWGSASNMRRGDVCKIRLEAFSNKDPAVAAKAMAHSSGTDECTPDLDKALAAVEKRAKDGDFPDAILFDLMSVLTDPWNNTKVSAAQKAKKLAILKLVAQNKKLSARARGTALENILRSDPKGGRAYVGNFKKDPDKDLAGSATRALEDDAKKEAKKDDKKDQSKDQKKDDKKPKK